jgi:hypothetical protein
MAIPWDELDGQSGGTYGHGRPIRFVQESENFHFVFN